MTDHDDPRPHDDPDLRAAFGRLSHDAQEVDTMNALRTHEASRKGSRAPLFGVLGVATAALILILGFVFIGGDDDSSGDDGSVITTDDGAGTDDGSDGGEEPDTAQADFLGTWTLVQGLGPDGPIPLVDGYPITMTLDADNGVGGTAACNGYGGRWSADDDSFTITDLSWTEMGCPEPPIMEAEQAFLGVLPTINQLSLDGAQLVLDGPSGAQLRFEREAPVATAELIGVEWILESLVQGDAVSSTMASSEAADLMLFDDGTVVGGTGCRAFEGQYVITGNQVQFTSFQMAGECSEELSQQDNIVVSVLEGPFTTEIDGDRLTVTAAGNEGLVYRAVAADGTTEPEPDDDDDRAAYSTDSSFETVPCFGDMVDPGTQEGGWLEEVVRIEEFASEQCRRTVFVVTDDNVAMDPAIAGLAHPFGGTQVPTPDGFILNQDTLLRDGGWISGVFQDADGNPFLYTDHGEGETRVTTWPGRVVVDTLVDGPLPDSVFGEVIIPRRPTGFPVEGTVTFAGFARPFEASGTVSLTRDSAQGAQAAGAPVEATWSGFDPLGDGYVGSSYGYSTFSIDTWGEFSFTIDGLAPGSYRLLFEAFNPEESGNPGTSVAFTVGDAEGVDLPAGDGPVPVLSGEGISYLPSPESGQLVNVAFADVNASVDLEALFGLGTEQEASPECPNGAVRSVDFTESGIAFDYDIDGQVLSWVLRPESQLTTLTGLGLGSTRADLEAAYDVDFFDFDSTLGIEFLITAADGSPGLGGLLEGTTDDAVITNLWAGQICAFR